MEELNNNVQEVNEEVFEDDSYEVESTSSAKNTIKDGLVIGGIMLAGYAVGTGLKKGYQKWIKPTVSKAKEGYAEKKAARKAAKEAKKSEKTDS